MTDTPVPTATERAQAIERIGQIDAKLMELPAWHEGRRALIDEKLKLAPIRYAPEPTPVPTGPTIAERRAVKAELRAIDLEFASLPAGHSDIAELIEYKIAVANSLSSLRPAPGTVTREDARTLAPESWTPAQHGMFDAIADTLGATPLQRMEWHRRWALHGEGKEPLADDAYEARLARHRHRVNGALARIPESARVELLAALDYPQMGNLFLDLLRGA